MMIGQSGWKKIHLIRLSNIWWLCSIVEGKAVTDLLHNTLSCLIFASCYFSDFSERVCFHQI